MKIEVMKFKVKDKEKNIIELLTQAPFVDRNHNNKDRFYEIPSFPPEILERASCSSDELKTLTPVLDYIYSLHDTARRIGILGIYEEHKPDEIADPFFRATLFLVLDGWRADPVCRFSSFEISNCRADGLELLKKLIYRDACLSLIKGNSPEEARTHFQKFFMKCA